VDSDADKILAGASRTVADKVVREGYSEAVSQAEV
jgi:hypothetical protein